MARRPSKLLSKLQIPEVAPEHEQRIKQMVNDARLSYGDKYL